MRGQKNSAKQNQQTISQGGSSASNCVGNGSLLRKIRLKNAASVLVQ